MYFTQIFCFTFVLRNVHERRNDATASRGSTFQTDPKNLQRSNASKKLIHGTLQYLRNDPWISRSSNMPSTKPGTKFEHSQRVTFACFSKCVRFSLLFFKLCIKYKSADHTTPKTAVA